MNTYLSNTVLIPEINSQWILAIKEKEVELTTLQRALVTTYKSKNSNNRILKVIWYYLDKPIHLSYILLQEGLFPTSTLELQMFLDGYYIAFESAKSKYDIVSKKELQLIQILKYLYGKAK